MGQTCELWIIEYWWLSITICLCFLLHLFCAEIKSGYNMCLTSTRNNLKTFYQYHILIYSIRLFCKPSNPWPLFCCPSFTMNFFPEHKRVYKLIGTRVFERHRQEIKISFSCSRAVFLNRRAAARYRALASIIPGRERFF